MADPARPKGKFYIVFSPTGKAPPKAEHRTHKSAFHQAHVLAAAHPGQSFFVMESKSRPIEVTA